MPSQDVSLGLLFSTTGPYDVIGRAMLNGAILGAEEVNQADLGVRLHPAIMNPEGNLASYPRMAASLLEKGIRHVVGCYTSSSRKEIIPLFEKYDGLLWYPSHYEGFESASHVVYTGAAPNQHIVPLIDYLLKNHGKRAFCVGSNYIWPWENNRILRETVTARAGSVLAERYFVVGETEFTQVIDAIIEARPSFVFVTLIGSSAYKFLRDFRFACRERGIDQPREMPVASCSLSEPELEAIGPDAVDGHLSSSVYFSSLPNAENQRFLSAHIRRFPDGPSVSADAEASYNAVWLLTKSLIAAGSPDIAAIKREVGRENLDAPQGKVRIDAQTLHAYLTPRIGRSNADARFDLIWEASAPVRPDPYLVHSSPRYEVSARPALRIVS